MSETKPSLLVVDGHSLAYRAFFALPVENFITKDQQHTNAIYGFLSMLVSLLKAEKPSHIAVAFDTSAPTFRLEEYPEYKGTRSETPAEFKGQIPLLQEALSAMGITVIEKDGFEADDILATLAKEGREFGWSVLLCSGDRDTIQLVNGDVTLLYPSVQGVSKLKRYDPETVFERYGVPPEQYPDIAALVGETSDNLPGVPKVGEKTAVKWLREYGSLDAIIENRESIKGVVGNNLREHIDNVIRNRKLNRLLDDVELPVTVNELGQGEIDQTALRDVFSRLEFRTLLTRVYEAMGTEPEPDPNATPQQEAPATSFLGAQELAQWLNALSTKDAIGVELEIDAAGIAAIGFASADAVAQGEWSPELAEAVKPWLESEHPKIFVDAKPQFKALLKEGIAVRGLIADPLLAGWLLRPAFPDKNLAHLSERFLDRTIKLSDPNQLLADEDTAGAGERAWYVQQLMEPTNAALPEGPSTIYREIELPSVPVLAGMEVAGVAVSRSKLSEFSHELALRLDQIEQDAYESIGHEVNLGSPKQLQTVLFEELELPKTRKTKTGYSTDAAALSELQESSPHPFLALLLAHRESSKLRQIIETLLAAIGPDGRIHTNYLQTGSQTGRLSSADPNLQNIPVRNEEGRRIRAAFEVGETYEDLLTADYSQIEMRIMAHLAEDPELISAFVAGEDLHNFVGARVFGVSPEDVTAQMRSKVKAMSYGLVYGLSAFGLAKQLRIEQSEAKDLMVEYFKRFGAVRDYLRASVEQAKNDGYTETIAGRRRPFPELASSNRTLRDNAQRQALNAPIQGAAADIMKIALNRVDTALKAAKLRSRLLMQIHDELVVEVAPGEWEQVAKIVKSEMSGAAQLKVPLEVQIGRGKNWDEAAH